jgi:glycosyltransferase involved in cell wall biosynthesis
MACGVPVIGSSSGEIPDVIGDAGLVFKEGSVEGLRLGLERLARNERLWGELRERGLRRVKEKYELTSVAQRMHRLFMKLVP